MPVDSRVFIRIVRSHLSTRTHFSKRVLTPHDAFTQTVVAHVTVTISEYGFPRFSTINITRAIIKRGSVHATETFPRDVCKSGHVRGPANRYTEKLLLGELKYASENAERGTPEPRHLCSCRSGRVEEFQQPPLLVRRVDVIERHARVGGLGHTGGQSQGLRHHSVPLLTDYPSAEQGSEREQAVLTAMPQERRPATRHRRKILQAVMNAFRHDCFTIFLRLLHGECVKCMGV